MRLAQSYQQLRKILQKETNMAVDKKSDYYTSAQNYTDLDGQSRSFTFIDHDKKTKIATGSVEGATKQLAEDRKNLVDRILLLPASACPAIFSDFTVRGEAGIHWNTAMISDAGMSMQQLNDIRTLTENRIDLYGV